MTVDEVTERQRWRMPLDELCWRAKTTQPELEEWSRLGAFGPRWKEPRDRGKWRHVTRDLAQQAIVMRALLDAGVEPEKAAEITSQHRRQDADLPLYVHSRGVKFIVNRAELNLP